MRARKVQGGGYECPACGDCHEGTPTEVTAYQYACDEVGDESPEVVELFICAECETLYSDRDEAKECCQ